MIKRKAKFSNVYYVLESMLKEYQDTHKNLVVFIQLIQKNLILKKFFLNKKTNFLFVGH